MRFEVKLNDGTTIGFNADENLTVIGERFTNHRFVQVGQDILIETSRVVYVRAIKEESK